MNGISQISFNNSEESISPKKPTSAAKQRELGGTLQNEPGTNSKKLMSSSKTKEIGGNDCAPFIGCCAHSGFKSF
jgi:hypothetical protein